MPNLLEWVHPDKLDPSHKGAVPEVSIVDRAANLQTILVIKSQENAMDEILKEILEGTLENEEEVKKAMEGKDESDVNAAIATIKMFNKSGLDMETLAKMAGVELPVKEVVKEVEKAAPEAKPDPDIPEAIRKEMDSLKAQADASEKLVKAMEDEKLTTQYVAKAAEYKGLPIKPEEFGPVLKEFGANASEASMAELDRVLRSASMAIEKGNLFVEVGKAGGDEKDAQSKLNAIAKKLAEADPKLTPEQAMVKAMTDNPELFKETRNQ